MPILIGMATNTRICTFVRNPVFGIGYKPTIGGPLTVHTFCPMAKYGLTSPLPDDLPQTSLENGRRETMTRIPRWQRLTNQKNRRASLYRQYRRFRYPNVPEIIPTAQEAWETAKLVERWERWESAGWVRIVAEPDDDAEREEGEEGEAFGSVGYVRLRNTQEPTQPIDPEYGNRNGWTVADSVWGHIGYRNCLDPMENPYAADVMRATLKAAQEEHYRAFELWANEPANAGFVEGYIRCIFFTNQGDREDPISKTMDCDIHSFCRATRLRVWVDCERFIRRAGERALDKIPSQYCPGSMFSEHWNGWESAGADFWYTRNGHGVGFWDRDNIPERTRERLQKIAQSFGEQYVNVIGGRIYLS
jgi:hypothetical protein